MKNITVLGAGLVGSLLAVMLGRRGHTVQLIEKRPDLRKVKWEDGRTINLALSERGWRALERVGLVEEVKQLAIPMYGRMMHNEKGDLTFQPYGKEGQSIYSVSRSQLNEKLMNLAEEEGKVQLFFEQKCTQVDLEKPAVHLTHVVSGEESILQPDILIGADGAFSAVRSAMQRTNLFNYQQYFIEHGYKELTIPPKRDGSWAIDKHALHIWPRGNFMLIALPNPDGSFTCTLFFPFKGEVSFDKIRTQADVIHYFETYFPDILPLMPNVAEEYLQNPTSSLVTIRCYPWTYKNKAAIIGDAAHAIVPFYGQGMNAGFEDCIILDQLMEKYSQNWEQIFEEYQGQRVDNAEAIADLALQNFVEMRDYVADPKFLLRKKIEAHIHQLYPDLWTPLYTMIAFSHIPYAEALRLGKKQDAIMQQIMATPSIEEKWPQLDYKTILQEHQQ
ncbi:NAD(P)/FAD-dependent oxidoreductase [Rhodocytophaga aerolata]|uniref:Kynurenine 3-monooxygenase n=1 Tax=Rhodocytophaga aerolata TaxID=455078 RepID=A0ABT8R625_9BACT|nr:NAD(P)/FAD-dependent oxidoreductase [Rhodocytophaga aerolata]MDO1447556.1 NAD(P)/FAD-dependent oxidoreductase [Rhodocytophaga aerolata]